MLCGNGSIGALVMGDPAKEAVIFSHEKMYLPQHKRLPAVDTGAHLDEIRQMLAQQRYQDAADDVVELSYREGYGEKRWTDNFFPLCQLTVEPRLSGSARDYACGVDYTTGVASVSFADEAVEFRRECFVSRANQTYFMRLSASAPAAYRISLDTYEEKGREMIHRLFPEYEARIAVGLSGRGSQCFGYDDELSADHDYTLGFSLWLTEEDEKDIGIELRRAYRELIPEARSQHSAMGGDGMGVMTIGEFYLPYTGSRGAPEDVLQWLYLPSHALAEATNGQVWRDDLGRFSSIRETLTCGMPEDVRIKKLAAAALIMAQSGQYNYSRCLRRGEQGAAMLAMGEFVRAASSVIFLLNRRHMPYYKWCFRAMGELPILAA